MDPARQLEHTLLALRGIARAAPDDALVERVEGFLRELPGARTSSGGVDALRSALDDWLAQMAGPLLDRVGTLLEAPGGQDLERVREVLRALWVLLDGVAGDARVRLAEIGGLLTTSLAQHDLARARRALTAARAWLAEHQWDVAARLRRPFGGER